MAQAQKNHLACKALPGKKHIGACIDWLLIASGGGIATLAGIMISHTWTGSYTINLCIAGLAFVLGLSLSIYGIHNRNTAAASNKQLLSPPASLASKASALPRIGEILVYKYHLITERDLKKALERQAGSGKRLGETLVEMDRISWIDLARTLEDQLSYGDPWKKQ